MKTPCRILMAVAACAALSLGNAFAQGDSDKPKKPERPPVEKAKADAPKKPAADKAPAPKSKPVPSPEKKADAPKKPGGPPPGRGPKGGPSHSEAAMKMREEMRGHFEEIRKLREAGKDDEAEKKMAEVRKKIEAAREKFGAGERGRGMPPMFAQRGQGPGKGGPPSWGPRGSRDADGRDRPKPPAKPSGDDAKPEDRKGPPHHHRGEGRAHHGDEDSDKKPHHRGRSGDKSKWAQHHKRMPMMTKSWGGPQMMKQRMAMMKRMAMVKRMAQARSGVGKKGKYGSAFRRGPGSWGSARFQAAPFMRGPWAARAQAHPRMRMMMAKRAAAAKAGKDGKADRKAKRAEKRGKGKAGKGRRAKDCEKCKESAEKKDS